MSEEEIIEMLKEYSATNPFQKSMFYVSNLHEAIQGLLDLYQKEKQKNKKLESRKYMFNAETGEITAIPIDNNYIPKSKVKEIIQKYYDEYEKEKEYRYTVDVEEEQSILREIEKELLEER